MQSEKDLQLQKIWKDVFKALGIDGLADEDAGQQSLSKITFGARSPERIRNRDGGSGANVFKGKHAASKALENGQIFAALEKIGDPEIARKAVEMTRKWLDTDERRPRGQRQHHGRAPCCKRLFGGICSAVSSTRTSRRPTKPRRRYNLSRRFKAGQGPRPGGVDGPEHTAASDRQARRWAGRWGSSRRHREAMMPPAPQTRRCHQRQVPKGSCCGRRAKTKPRSHRLRLSHGLSAKACSEDTDVPTFYGVHYTHGSEPQSNGTTYTTGSSNMAAMSDS
jgi:hypothetical protein